MKQNVTFIKIPKPTDFLHKQVLPIIVVNVGSTLRTSKNYKFCIS